MPFCFCRNCFGVSSKRSMSGAVSSLRLSLCVVIDFSIVSIFPAIFASLQAKNKNKNWRSGGEESDGDEEHKTAILASRNYYRPFWLQFIVLVAFRFALPHFLSGFIKIPFPVSIQN